MRIAKVFEGRAPTVALAHGSGLYRAATIEEVLGSTLPEGTSQAFDDRIFALGLAGLDVTHAELTSGTHLEDTRIPPGTSLLPPTGRDPAVLELSSTDRAAAPRRLNGRALYGHESSVPLPFSAFDDDAGAGVGFGLGFIVGEELRRSAPRAAWDAVVGACLAITFWLGERRAGQFHPTSDARELGTALGPWLVTHDEWPRNPACSTSLGAATLPFDGPRIGDALARLSWLGEVRAGDVLLLASDPTWVTATEHARLFLEAPSFGRLEVGLGGPPGIPGDGAARIDR